MEQRVIKALRSFLLVSALLFTVARAVAQSTFAEMEQLTVNENVSTIITASEPIMMVDISTDSVVGDRPLDNVLRVKPKTGNHQDGDILGIATIITERYRTQYALVYTSRIEEAVSDKEVELVERNAFHNPEVSMSTSDMVGYAMKVWNTPAKYRGIFTRFNKMEIRLNNIYVVGDYIFVDFSVTNNTNLPFDIDELRVKLQDKKQQKATNVQTIELKPALVLDRSVRFSKAYRNVIVLKKMTFPNDKVLTIELSEKQISGRTISLNLDYEDVLAADGFTTIMLTNFYQMEDAVKYSSKSEKSRQADTEAYWQMEDRSKKLDKDISDKEQRLASLKREVSASESAFRDYDDKAQSMQSTVAGLQQEIDARKSELRQLNSKVNALKKALRSVGTDSDK